MAAALRLRARHCVRCDHEARHGPLSNGFATLEDAYRWHHARFHGTWRKLWSDRLGHPGDW